jgi:ABC-type molybdenum transport system, ATPase component/photorepair protein PhrA
MPVIELNHVSCKQGAKMILNDINLEINEGERWVVLGKNGCGKTTLASIIAGYRGNYSGNVRLWDHGVDDYNVIDLRKRIGFISDSYFGNCYKRELGLEIILGGICGQLCEQFKPTDKDIAHAKKLLASFGVRNKGLYPYDLLSKGQQQMVLLSRAFMSPKEILIMDEPCSGLDIFSREFLLNTLADLSNHTDVTIFYITHHIEEIIEIFDHALLIDSGIVHSQGEIHQVLNSQNLSDFFHCRAEASWNNGCLNLKILENYKMNSDLWNLY